MKTEEKILLGIGLLLLVWPWREAADVTLDYDPPNNSNTYPVYPNNYDNTYGPGYEPGVTNSNYEWWLNG